MKKYTKLELFRAPNEITLIIMHRLTREGFAWSFALTRKKKGREMDYCCALDSLISRKDSVRALPPTLARVWVCVLWKYNTNLAPPLRFRTFKWNLVCKLIWTLRSRFCRVVENIPRADGVCVYLFYVSFEIAVAVCSNGSASFRINNNS